MVGEDADPDVLAERLLKGVVARHDEEVGRLVRAGDDDLFGQGQLGRLGGAAVNGRQTGRDAVAEAFPASVSVAPARERSNRRADNHVSSLAIWRLTAACEVRSSRAARVKLACRAALSKASSAFAEGIR